MILPVVADSAIVARLEDYADRLDDVTLGDDRPAPVILPVAPLAGGGYATFDLLRTRAVGFRVRGDSLLVGEAAAIRAPR